MKKALESATVESKRFPAAHELQLYSSAMDKYFLHAAFLSQATEGNAFYVTQEEKRAAANTLASYGVTRVSVISPREISALEGQVGARILVDYESLENPEFIERKIGELKGNEILCAYNNSRVEPNKIKVLVELHDKLVLSTPESTVISHSSLKKLGNEAMKKVVKKNLDTLVLALVNQRSMTGMDLIKVLHKEFDVMVSPGRIYPLLSELEKKGLITFEYALRNKVYKIKNFSEVRQMLFQHSLVSNVLSGLYQGKAVQT